MTPPEPPPQASAVTPPMPATTIRGHAIEPRLTSSGMEIPEGVEYVIGRPTRMMSGAERRTSPPGKGGEPPQDGWVTAPSTSHLSRFALDGADLYVGFKGPGGVGEIVTGVYNFSTEIQAQEMFERCRSSPHPYGEVLYPLVVTEGIPWTRLS